MKIKNNKAGIFVLLSLLIFSCLDPLTYNSPQRLPDQGLPDQELPEGFGSFSLRVENAQRTILPSAPVLTDFAAYTLTFTATSGGMSQTADRTNANLTTAVTLAVGTYTLTVKAYMDADKTRLAAQGTLTGIVIGPGAHVSEAVTLRLFAPGSADTGSGTFTWDINITASDVSSASMAITKDNTPANGSPVDLLTTSAGSFTIPSGVYNMRFTLTKDGAQAVWNEILYVYAELTSDFTFEFDDDFFYTTHYTVTLVYNNGSDDGTPSVTHGGTLTQPLNPAMKAGYYVFDGWCTDESLTVLYVFTTQVYKDFTLYARWKFDLYAAVAAFATAAEDMVIAIPQPLDITMGANITIPANSGKTLTITSETGGTRAIYRGTVDTTSANGLFIMGSNVNLILRDIIIDGAKGTYTNNAASLVRVNGGTLTLEDGAVLRNNRAYEGGAVSVNSGTFTMNNGEITDNTATNRGGGVYVYNTFTMNGGKIHRNNSSGGGVYVYFGTFNLNNGDIFENTGSNGGGVYNNYSRFTMSGGKISDNTATSNGGGVYNDSGSSSYYFTMSGGEISGNTASSTSASGGNGGGVYNSSTFTMSGSAVISGNTASSTSASGGNGGGVYIYSGNTYYVFNMYGGEITNNTVTGSGGGVYNSSFFTIGGASKISGNLKSDDSTLNNVYLVTHKFIKLGTGSNIPANTMEIYINFAGTDGIIVFGGAQASDKEYFKTDDPEKTITHYPVEGHLGIDRSLDSRQLDFYMKVAAYADAVDDALITLDEDLVLPIPVTVPANAAGKILTIQGSGANISLIRGFSDTDSSYSALFLVSSNARLIFENIIIDGAKGTYTGNTTSLVRVNGGTFTLGNGAVLRNNRSSQGGGVYVNSGTFTMNNGEITDNTVTSSGGGVYVSNTFTMNGGKIKNNSSSEGGGVYVSSSTFNMVNGEISENTATSSGGGVYRNSNSTFTMSGGKIKDNNAANGGGVYNYYSSGNYPFTMSGGEISGNTATSNGGGVYNYYYTYTNSTTGETTIYNSTFNMSGGKISGNGAGSNGGGVYSFSIFNLGGTAVVKENVKTDASKNNVYLTNGKYITIGNGTTSTGNVPAPASGMEVYVQTATSTGVIVNSGAAAAHAVYFHADEDNKTVAHQSEQLVLTAAGSGGITITFNITDEAPAISGNTTIYRTNNITGRPRSVTLTTTGGSSYQWYWNGNLLSSTNSVTLSVDNPLYGNLIGPKLLTLEAMVGGKPYNRTITFTVEQ